MITTQQLATWQSEISNTLTNALNLASRFSENKEMCAYYTHLAKTADAQLSLITRLSMQSAENDKEAKNEK